MKNKTKIPGIITIAILTAVTTVFWVFFGVYRTITKKPVYEVPSEILEPIDPVLNKTAIEKMEARLYFNPEEIAAVSSTPAPQIRSTPQPTLEPTPSTTPAASVSPTPEATGGPQI